MLLIVGKNKIIRIYQYLFVLDSMKINKYIIVERLKKY